MDKPTARTIARAESDTPSSRRKAPAARASFTVFAKFRRKRLRLASGIRTLESALSIADRLRRERFHDPQGIMVVDDRTDEVVDEEAVRATVSVPEEPALAPPSWTACQEAAPTSETIRHDLSREQLDAIDRMRQAAEAARKAREKHLQILETRLNVVRARSTGPRDIEGEQLEQLIMALRIEEDAARVSLERTIAALLGAGRASEPDPEEDLTKTA